MGNKRNLFNLSKENSEFLRIFQVLGFLPFALQRNEKKFGTITFHILTALIFGLIVLKCFVKVSQPFIVIMFVCEISMLFLGQFLNWRSIHRQKTILTLIGEIDEKFKNILNKSEELMKGNVRMQRVFIMVWAVYLMATLYYPIIRMLRGDFSVTLVLSLTHVVTWSVLIHIHTTKFLYFYAMIAVRLDVIKQCLDDTQKDKLFPGHFLIREVPRDKFAQNMAQHSKLMALKEIYDRCWQLQGHVYQLSGIFLLTYFIGYTGQIIYLMFFYMKPSILGGTFKNQFIEILVWLALFNVSTISYFVVSQNMYLKGLKIAGSIHQIAQNNINDGNIVQAVILMSLQIEQQPITTISILGIFNYDRTNLNAVSKEKVQIERLKSKLSFQVVILYSSLFYEAVQINVKMIDLKEQAKQLGVNPDTIKDASDKVQSITM